jgi:hypothetical protein
VTEIIWRIRVGDHFADIDNSGELHMEVLKLRDGHSKLTNQPIAVKDIQITVMEKNVEDGPTWHTDGE